jgi:hypothetical protein
MVIAIQPVFQNIDFPKIFVDEQVPAPAENVRRWITIRDHTFENGKQLRMLITWTCCPEVPATYEPLAHLNDDGTPTQFLAGMIQPDMTYKIASTLEDLNTYTQIAQIQNPESGDIYQMPFSMACVSATLRNMFDDLGGLDSHPIPIGSNIINGTVLNTLRLFQMFQILGNPTISSDIIKNWANSKILEIDVDMRISQIDTILKSSPQIDETISENEISSAINYQFKYVSGWADYIALNYWFNAVDFFDIQPLYMYIANAYASKMAHINS